MFASEPMVRNPVACTWNSKGRFWVAENYTYERLNSHLNTRFRDRVMILDDTDEDGKADQRTAFHARQIQGFKDPALTAKLTESWCQLSAIPAVNEELLQTYRKELTAAALAKADKSNGRLLHEALCGSCHKLYGQGAKVGPDLTGSGRHNLDYLLENIVTPSAIVTADYQVTIVRRKDGRVLNGIIRGRDRNTLTLQTMTSAETISLDQIASTEKLPASLMPPGLLGAPTPEMRRDLIASLMHPNQVPKPGE